MVSDGAAINSECRAAARGRRRSEATASKWLRGRCLQRIPARCGRNCQTAGGAAHHVPQRADHVLAHQRVHDLLRHVERHDRHRHCHFVPEFAERFGCACLYLWSPHRGPVVGHQQQVLRRQQAECHPPGRERALGEPVQLPTRSHAAVLPEGP